MTQKKKGKRERETKRDRETERQRQRENQKNGISVETTERGKKERKNEKKN